MPKNYPQVVKHNSLIGGRHSLGLLEQRLMLSVIAKIDSRTNAWDGRDGRFRIDISDVIKLIQSNHKNQRSQIMGITESLLSKVVTIKLGNIDDDLKDKFKKIVFDKGESPLTFSGETVQTHWIMPPVRHVATMDYLDVKIDKFLMPFLISIKNNFTTYSLEQALRLKSKYSIRLLEILKKDSFKKTTTIDYNELREIIGIMEGKYRRFSDFKKRILDVAMAELDNHCDINFTYEENRKRNKVVSLTFFIFQKSTKPTNNKRPVVAPEDSLIDRLRGIKINKKNANDLIQEYGREVVQSELKTVSEHQHNGKDAGVLITKLRGVKESELALAREQEERKRLETIRQKHRKYWGSEKHRIRKNISIGDRDHRYLSVSVFNEGKQQTGETIIFGRDDFVAKLEKYLIPIEKRS